MSSSQIVSLESLCRIVRGSSPRPKSDSRFFGGNVPRLMVEDLTRDGRYVTPKIDSLTEEGAKLSRPVPAGTIVIVVSGSVGQVAQLNIDACIHDGFVGLLDLDTKKIRPEFLMYYLETLRGKNQKAATGAVWQNLTTDQIKKIEISLPPLEQQQRIAAILDAADALRAKRRESLVKLEMLLRSVFLEMFGDPVTNPKGWHRVRFGDILESIDSGWSPQCQERKVATNEWGVLKLGAVTSCYFKEGENKALHEGTVPKQKLEVKSGDLLFSRKNTYDLVAACALVDETRPRLMLPDLIFRFVFKESTQVKSEYIWSLFTYPSKRKNIQLLANGAAGSMPNISKGNLLELQIELPPIEKQIQFAQFHKLLTDQKKKFQYELSSLESLFSSLQHQAFNGTLTAHALQEHTAENHPSVSFAATSPIA